MGSEAPGATSDRELWQRAADGDSTAFGEIFERHAKAVYNHLFRRISDWSQAEDSNRDSVLVTETLSYRGYPPVTTRSASGGVLTLGYRCRSGDCGDAYRIEVPRSLSVRISSGTGRILLASLAGQIHASAGVGSIRGTGLSGTFAEFHTGVGSIDATFTSPPGHLAASAGTGSVVLLVPGGPGYDVAASASVGSVSVRVRQDAASGHVIDAIANLGSVTVAKG
jgi:hypothetical protein